MKNKLIKTYLFFAGTILMLVGFYIGFMPTDYLAQFSFGNTQNNGHIGNEIVSEMRGMGGSLFVFGAFILSGAFLRGIQKMTLIISALVFFSFTLFRTMGIVLDGMPAQSILLALSIEVLFAISVVPLLLEQSRNSNSVVH